jgi:hypothetical protein
MRKLALLVAVAILGGCSGDDSTTSTTRRSTTSTRAPSTGTPTTARPTLPASAEAAGWRLAVRQPAAGATIGARSRLCYELGAPSREPVAELEVTLHADGEPASASTRVPITVGRASVELDLPKTASGVYDMQVQLIANGEAVPGALVTIPGITFTTDAPLVACE